MIHPDLSKSVLHPSLEKIPGQVGFGIYPNCHNPTFGYTPTRNKNDTIKLFLYVHLYCSPIHSAMTWIQPCCLQWTVDKESIPCIHNALNTMIGHEVDITEVIVK